MPATLGDLRKTLVSAAAVRALPGSGRAYAVQPFALGARKGHTNRSPGGVAASGARPGNTTSSTWEYDAWVAREEFQESSWPRRRMRRATAAGSARTGSGSGNRDRWRALCDLAPRHRRQPRLHPTGPTRRQNPVQPRHSSRGSFAAHLESLNRIQRAEIAAANCAPLAVSSCAVGGA